MTPCSSICKSPWLRMYTRRHEWRGGEKRRRNWMGVNAGVRNCIKWGWKRERERERERERDALNGMGWCKWGGNYREKCLLRALSPAAPVRVSLVDLVLTQTWVRLMKNVRLQSLSELPDSPGFMHGATTHVALTTDLQWGLLHV